MIPSAFYYASNQFTALSTSPWSVALIKLGCKALSNSVFLSLQLLDLFTQWDWSTYLVDYGKPTCKYLRVNPHTSLALLEKWVLTFSPLSPNTSFELSLLFTSWKSSLSQLHLVIVILQKKTSNELLHLHLQPLLCFQEPRPLFHLLLLLFSVSCPSCPSCFNRLQKPWVLFICVRLMQACS